MLRIEEILLPESVASDYDAEAPFNSLRNIRRLNAFIGPNNSGKSRLMRSLFLVGANLTISTDDGDATCARDIIRRIARRIPDKDGNRQFDENIDKLRTLCEEGAIGFHRLGQQLNGSNQARQTLKNLPSEIDNLARHRSARPDGSDVRSIANDLTQLDQAINRLERKSKTDRPDQTIDPPMFQNAEFVYVPTLRGMRLGVDNDNAKFAYFDRTWTDYVKESDRHNRSREDDLNQARAKMSGKTVFTGLDLYDVLTDRLLGSLADRQFIRQYEEYLSGAFFRGQPVALIPRREHDTVNIKIGNEAERPVQSLGDGLQQIIILTWPMFERQDKPLFLFIEEPDLFLHPGYQRAFIDAIFDHPNPNLYVFVTTHSNQFLDITISEEGCSIFRCSKQPAGNDHPEHNPRFAVRNVTTGDHELLRHIGARPSSVMFANCTIWVEGITDRLYYGRFLQLLLEERGVNLIENMHYAFVEYGGGNITHWSFLDEEEGMDVERICARLFLITDLDDGKERRHLKLQNALRERFHRLDVREVENLLSPSTITAVIRDYESGDIQINDFSETAYRLKYLGKYIDGCVLADKTKSKRFSDRTNNAYADESGTVKDKVRFCQKALSHITLWDDLSDGAKEVAEKLFRFVVDEND